MSAKRTRATAKEGPAGRRSEATPIIIETFVPSKVNILATQLTAAFTREIEPYGLSVWDWRVLLTLDGEASMRLSDLSQRTRIDLSTLSRLVRRLEARGLCEIEVTGRDRRVGAISVAAQGRKILASLVPIGQAFEEGMLAGMSEDERAACRTMLDRLRDNLEGFLGPREQAKSA